MSIDIKKAVIARLKTHGANFEVLVDCDKAIAFRGGSPVDIKDVLAVYGVFSDSKKGEHASETQMHQIFGTSDILDVAKEIVKRGEIQLTAEYRERLRETKRRQIIDIIHRNGVDPKTHLPHPPQRISAALDEAKVRIDEYTPAEQQIDDIVKELRTVLPIKFEVKEIEIKIPPAYAGRGYSAVQGFGKILNQEWQSDGSLKAVLEIPGGLEEELYSRLNSITHGDIQAKVLRVK